MIAALQAYASRDAPAGDKKALTETPLTNIAKAPFHY
jgi:hypothetical protein